MIEAILGTNGGRFILASATVALGLLCLVGIFWFLRNRPSSPFIRGGKNRQPRLAVLDAAAVDTRRRLVLVRRDDVEHLIMIGGPTDIVIESRIAPPRAAAASEGPAPAAQAAAAERRAAAQAETKANPVSGMGNVLYGEGPDRAAQQARPAAAARTTVNDAATLQRATAPDRAAAAQGQQRSQQPAAMATGAASGGKAPEDILEAARTRVLSAGPVQPVATQQRAGQVTGTAPGEPQKARPDFESLLDAEISGDLQRLSPDPANPGTIGQRASALPSVASVRQEPALEMPAQGARKEPSLEEEMNRMLGEIAVNRKT